MKKKTSANVITWWLEGWVSQTHQVWSNNRILDVFLVSKEQIELLRRSEKVLNLQMLCITKLKALLIKSLDNTSFSSESTHFMKKQLLLDITALKFSGNTKKNIFDRAHTIFPLISTPGAYWTLKLLGAGLIKKRCLFQN